MKRSKYENGSNEYIPEFVHLNTVSAEDVQDFRRLIQTLVKGLDPNTWVVIYTQNQCSHVMENEDVRIGKEYINTYNAMDENINSGMFPKGTLFAVPTRCYTMDSEELLARKKSIAKSYRKSENGKTDTDLSAGVSSSDPYADIKSRFVFICVDNNIKREMTVEQVLQVSQPKWGELASMLGKRFYHDAEYQNRKNAIQNNINPDYEEDDLQEEIPDTSDSSEFGPTESDLDIEEKNEERNE